MALPIAFYLLFDKEVPQSELVSYFLDAFALWSMLGAGFSFVASVVVGIPTVLILRKLGLLNLVSTVLVGGLVGYILGGLTGFRGEVGVRLQLLTTVYGIVCSYGFYKGYSSNNCLQRDPDTPRV